MAHPATRETTARSCCARAARSVSCYVSGRVHGQHKRRVRHGCARVAEAGRCLHDDMRRRHAGVAAPPAATKSARGARSCGALCGSCAFVLRRLKRLRARSHCRPNQAYFNRPNRARTLFHWGLAFTLGTLRTAPSVRRASVCSRAGYVRHWKPRLQAPFQVRWMTAPAVVPRRAWRRP